jgi:hypothetical protein
MNSEINQYDIYISREIQVEVGDGSWDIMNLSMP